MKLNYSQPLVTLSGDNYTDDKGQPLTLLGAITMVCSAAVPGDEALDALAKYKIGEIAIVAYKGLDLTSEQVAEVKKRVAKVFASPVLVYLAYQALEG